MSKIIGRDQKIKDKVSTSIFEMSTRNSLSSNEQLKLFVEKVGDIEFSKWQGMSSIIDRVTKEVDLHRQRTGKINGWVILAVVVGIEEVRNRLVDNMNLVALVRPS
jgi:hypothetical protein